MSTLRKKLAPLAGYWSWFSFCFTVAFVLTFPLTGLKPLVIGQLETVLGKGRQGVHGVDPVVTIGDLGISGLGVKAERVSIQLGSTNPDPGQVFDLDSVWLSASLLSLVSSNKTVQIEAALYGGDIDADITVDDKQQPIAIDATIDDVDLGKVTPLMMKLGLPMTGIADGKLDLELGAQAEKDAHGTLELDVKGLGLGSGKLTIAGVPGDFNLENGMALGDLKLRAPIDKGAGTLELKLEGTPEVEAEVTGSLSIKPKMTASRVDLDGWIRPTAALLAKDARVKSAVELADQFGGNKAKDDDGRYHFSVKGPLTTLRPAMSRDGGRRASTKSKKGAATAPADAPPPAPVDDPKDE